MKATYIFIFLFLLASDASQIVCAQKASSKATGMRINVRPTEQDRLFKQRISLRNKATPAEEVLESIEQATRLKFTIDKELNSRPRKLTLFCTQMAPAQVLVAIGELYGGEWVRKSRGVFCLVPRGRGEDPAENILAEIQAEIDKLSPDSNQSDLSSADQKIVSAIQDQLYYLRGDPLWSEGLFLNGVLTRKEKVGSFFNNQTQRIISWGLGSRQEEQVGDLRTGRVATKFWTYSK
ncbi:MAG: hypothetical protein IT210_10115 [Armatimonadetes bacterium]|nr:hypothetical protein [Armatimonadota bacterium]